MNKKNMISKKSVKKELKRIYKQYPDGNIPEDEYDVIVMIKSYGLLENSKDFIDGSFFIKYSEKDLDFIKSRFFEYLLKFIQLLLNK